MANGGIGAFTKAANEHDLWDKFKEALEEIDVYSKMAELIRNDEINTGEGAELSHGNKSRAIGGIPVDMIRG